MSESDLVNMLRLTHEALLLVSQGSSERSAISRIASANPQLRREKSSALALVIDVMSRIDALDRAIWAALPGAKLDRRSLALYRLVSHIIFSDVQGSKANLVRSIRKLSSERESPRLEQLLGNLVARGPPDISRSANEIERAGLQSHNP